MFAAEAAGLNALASAAGDTLIIPRVLHTGPLPSPPNGRPSSFIVMEHLDLGAGVAGRLSQRALGTGLATVHAAPPADSRGFGFASDNWIGGSPQPNGWMESWVDFFRERRLLHMNRLLARPGSPVDRMVRQLAAPGALESFFDDGEEVIRPSLIHGDLWSGNMSIAGATRSPGGAPGWSILDPAAYYAHDEAEFGMSWCASFGGEFWEGYRSLIPEAPGFAKRRPLYELYHIMNHAVMFGGGYVGQAEALLARLTRGL